MRKIKHLLLVISFAVLLLAFTSSQPFLGLLAESQPSNDTTKSPPNMPPLELLGQGARPPTAAELAAEKAFDAQRIQQAAEWLASADFHQRLIGVQQLNAYQYPSSESILSKVLRQDAMPEVRLAAAQSLGLFKHMEEATQQALLAALGDSHQGTALAALDTLLMYATRISFDSQGFPRLLGHLKQRLQAGHLDKAVARGLEVFIADQRPVCNPLFGPCSSG